MQFHTGFNIDDSHSAQFELDCSNDPTRTQQQFKEETDINEIVRRFGITGELPTNYRAPLTEDFQDIIDFRSAMNAVRAAEEQFLQMPADLRARFANDPQQLLDFLANEKNRDEALRLGLLQSPTPDSQAQPKDETK